MADTNNPAPNGTTSDETLEQRLAQFDREKKGLIRDLQTERETRHALEERLSQIETSLTSAANEPDDGPSSNKVALLSRDPDGYIDDRIMRRLEERLKPVEQSFGSAMLERKLERAYAWVAKQEKIDPEEVVGSTLEEELVETIKGHQLGSLDPVEGTKAAYKILQQERKEKAEREQDRSRTIAGNSPESVRIPPRTGSSGFTAAQIAGMTPDEYARNRDAILAAQKAGTIKP